MQIDPKKKDYVVVNGSSVGAQRLLDSTYFALCIPQGKWLHGDPRQGSLLFTMQNVKRTSNIEEQIGAFTTDAIKSQIIDTGMATAQQFRNLTNNRTDSENQTQIIPAASKLETQLSFVPV